MKKAACMAILALALLTGLPAAARADITAIINHDHITIDFLYHGSTVSVKGITEPGTDIVIKIASPDTHQSLKHKGKVGGVLWMNTGTLNFEHVPDVYYLHSTKKVEEVLSEEERIRYGLGYDALESRAEVTPVSGEAEKTKWFEEFVKFKEGGRLYATTAGRVDLTNADGQPGYCMLADWYYQAPPGTYAATVYAVKGGRVIETAQAEVKVEQIGGVKSLANMARNNGALYGAISIIAAIGAGFGVGIIFRKDGGAH